jgi:hypothetical protein
MCLCAPSMRVTIRHRYSAIEKLIAYLRGQTRPQDNVFGCRAAISRQFVLSWPHNCATIPCRSVCLPLSGGTYARVAELGKETLKLPRAKINSAVRSFPRHNASKQ